MCVCTPGLRTPYCGRGTCQWPTEADGPTQVPTDACMDCAKPYAEFPLDVVLPRAQWLAIHADEGGLLCASCIVARVRARIPGATVCHLIVEVRQRG